MAAWCRRTTTRLALDATATRTATIPRRDDQPREWKPMSMTQKFLHTGPRSRAELDRWSSDDMKRMQVYQRNWYNPVRGRPQWVPYYKMPVMWLDNDIRQLTMADLRGSHYEKDIWPKQHQGIWYSELMDHWVHIPMSPQAYWQIDREGGIDNFILNRNAEEVGATFAERLRKGLHARTREVEKNFVLEQQARSLAAHLWAGEGGGFGVKRRTEQLLEEGVALTDERVHSELNRMFVVDDGASENNRTQVEGEGEGEGG